MHFDLKNLPAPLHDPRAVYKRVESEPFPVSITALLQEVTKRQPGKDALRFIDGSPSLTYLELEDRVSRIAGGLRQAGVRPGDRIAVLLANKPAYPITYLAAARLGATIVPVNTAFTVRELVFVLNDAEARFAVVDASFLQQLSDAIPEIPTLSVRSLFVVDGPAQDSQSWEALAKSEPYVKDDATLDTLMTIQYTSGTTGWPKGALLSQEFWICIGMAQSAELKYLDISNILVVHAFFYMDPFWQLMMSFCMEGTIVLAPRMSASTYMVWVREHNIHYGLVTSHIFKQKKTSDDSINNLRILQTYGFSREIHEEFERRFNVPVRETFGMTEIGAGAFVPVAAVDKVGSGAVGIPAPFRRLKIVKDNGEEAATGEIGELFATGRGLFLGYNNQPETTRDTIVDGWVRTGDLFRKDDDGYYYIVGRIKDMIRRNMENISAREVEDILIGHPAVANAAVLGVPDSEKGEEVLALVILRDGVETDQTTADGLFEYCLSKLAKFKVPRFIGFRTAFPMTPSAKVAKQEIRRSSENLLFDVFERNQ